MECLNRLLTRPRHTSLASNDRFPYEQHTTWDPDTKTAKHWTEEMERIGIENVRAIVGQADSGSPAKIRNIGLANNVTKGFAQEWLAWHDKQRTDREEEVRRETLRAQSSP